MSLIVQDLSYIHPNKDFLFQNITFTIPAGEKCAIVGIIFCHYKTGFWTL